ncbi:replication-relaxation family protein [Streptomyces sp. NPDC004393]
MWFPTSYGVQIASEWPELRGRRPPKTVSDPTAARLRVGHTLTVTETALLFLEDACRRGELCRPLDWLPEVYHPIGGGEAVIPDALMYYRRGSVDGEGSMLRAFIEVDRATMGPERLAAKLTAYARLYHYVPAAPGRHRPTIGQGPVQEEWRRRYPLFPRVLFVLDGTGPAGITTRIRALHATAADPALAGFLHGAPVVAASLVDLRNNGPSEPVAPHTGPRPQSGLEPGPGRVDRPAQPTRSAHRLRATAAQSFRPQPRPWAQPQPRPQALRKELRTEPAADAQYWWTAAQSVHTDESEPAQPRSYLPWSGSWSPQPKGPPRFYTPSVSTGTW